MPDAQVTPRLPRLLAFAMCISLLTLWPAQAQPAPTNAQIQEFAARALELDVNAVQVGALDGLARPVRQGGNIIAYLGSTWGIAHTSGYSGQPVDILVLVDRGATIRGTLLVAQQEPVLTIGISPQQIENYINGFSGFDLREPVAATTSQRSGVPDAIAGATISSSVIRSGIVRTARMIAETYGLLDTPDAGRISMAAAAPHNWQQLADMGAVASLHVSVAEADDALVVAGNAERTGTFINLHVAVLDPPSVGVNLLGESAYSTLLADMPVGSHALFVGASGLYSFKGTAWRKSGFFERIELEQGARTIALAKSMHLAPENLSIAGAPELREQGIFVLPADSGFDPTRAFRLSLLVAREDTSGATRRARFSLDYALPQSFVVAKDVSAAPAGEEPLWQQNWQERIPQISVITAMLLGLYFILIFQNQIAQRRRLYVAIRLGYLSVTVVILGAVMGTQLSVVHVLTFLQELRSEFSWDTFLLEPVIFITWAWVAIALLFWGRVYCGWLCPFGALQELLNKAGRFIGIKQVPIPFSLHERMWPLKYIIFIGLFAMSLASMPLAFRAAEVEPFKTVVTLRFIREWPFIAYALALLAAGLFVERFFCRYLCPLGAALAIPARLRMFEWLKRRPQCGKECRICASKCPVQAIHPEGQINPNECIYCINCQTLYYNKHVCPPLKARAARRAAIPSNPGAPQ